jgi:hypothetical protein
MIISHVSWCRQVDEDRTERVELIAELLCEMPFPTESEAEQASYRLEAFANLYGPNNSKDLQIRTKVLRYEDKDWGIECDYRQAGGSWRKIGFNHRPGIGEDAAAYAQANASRS